MAGGRLVGRPVESSELLAALASGHDELKVDASSPYAGGRRREDDPTRLPDFQWLLHRINARCRLGTPIDFTGRPSSSSPTPTTPRSIASSTGRTEQIEGHAKYWMEQTVDMKIRRPNSRYSGLSTVRFPGLRNMLHKCMWSGTLHPLSGTACVWFRDNVR
ncbi:unnamed protein product [Urochloa humidicola]